MRKSWDQHFLDIAKLVAERSKDPHTKVGAVLVRDRRIISSGYNGIPRGVLEDDPKRHLPPTKYLYYEHAERNALYNSVYEGISTKGSTLYCTWTSCTDCARGLIQAGIKRIVVPEDPVITDIWLENFSIAGVMLKEAGIGVEFI